jgi:hypothetical protein
MNVISISPRCAELLRRKGFTADALPASVPAEEPELYGRSLRIPPHLARDGVVIHMHDQEPEGGELEQRIAALERAITIIAHEIVGEEGEGAEPNGEEEGEDAAGVSPAGSWKPDLSGQGGQRFAPGMSETSELRKQVGVQKYANELSTGSTSSPSTAEKRMSNQDTLPDIEDINRKNATFWATPKASETVTAGANEPPPGTRSTGTGENYLPGGRDIDMAARLSHTSQVLNRGKTWGTSDAALQMARYYQAQDAKANALVNNINARNAAAWRR